MTTDVFPNILNKDIAKCRSQCVLDDNLKLLNKEIETTIGLGEKTHTLAQHVTNVKVRIDSKCGLHNPIKYLCKKIQKWYQLLSVNEDVDVHLVKKGTTKNKDKLRQIASTSVINLASHIITG